VDIYSNQLNHAGRDLQPRPKRFDVAPNIEPSEKPCGQVTHLQAGRGIWPVRNVSMGTDNAKRLGRVTYPVTARYGHGHFPSWNHTLQTAYPQAGRIAP
jgi:hypothetical protein